MKDLDLLHRQNMALKPILKMSLGLARDVLNLHDRYEDLKPTFKTSEFCKATHKVNLVDYAKQKADPSSPEQSPTTSHFCLLDFHSCAVGRLCSSTSHFCLLD
ncbi:hypothetical protein L3X38_000118 [Prunus dulcis]|uniref:Uncharacterized protein n=1 Tax=Prunus dulcis TaxID=3755 RepID=A0AAD4UPH5_PRUDU|nr:hypothetical protein L3X38_000118 [Prunus dulcis]